MRNNDNSPSRLTPSPRTGRPILRSIVALVALVGGICVTAVPASGSPPTVPDAPSIAGITIGQNTVEVGFDAGADGGSAITGYTVTCDSGDGGTTQSNTGTSSPITVSSLTNGNTYACTVVATNAVGDSAASDPSDDFVAITTPDAPTITGVTRGSSSAAVAFTAGADGGDPVAFFKVTCTSTTGGTTRSKTGVSSPLTVSSLSNGRTYTCVVVATNSIGDGTASAASSSFVAGTNPAAPSISGVTRGDNSAIVAITPHGTGGLSLTGYTATCTSSDGGATQTATDVTSPVTVSSLSNGKTYTCTAYVTNSLGNSGTSIASSGFLAATMPDAPTLGVLTPGSNSISVAVTGNADGGDGITGFTVTCTSSDGGATQSASDSSSPVTVTSLTNGKTYSCTAVATNTIGDSPASAASNTFLVVGRADPPTITTLDLDRGAVVVGFTPNSDGGDTVTGFTVTCASSDGGTPQSNTGATSPITVSSLSGGNLYTCTAVATNSFGASDASDASSPFQAGDLPSAPTISSVTRGNNSASIAITSNGDGGTAITSYRVTCRSSNGGLTRSTTGASSPVTITSLSNGRAYTCTVVATNAIGDSPASAASSSFVAGRTPDAPTLTGVTRGSNSAVVSFTANGNGGNAITSFTATCTSSDGGTTRTASGASSPITVGSLSNGNTYTCTVVATNAINDSAASSASTSFVAATNPSAPTLTGVTLGNDSGAVAFTANSDGGDSVTAFTATCTSSNGGTTRTASDTSSPITVGSLTDGKTYTCTVLATNGIGNSSASSASTSFVAGTVPDAPTLTGVTRGSNSATVAFTANGTGGSAITSFTATCTSSDGGTTRSDPNTTSPITVGSLSNGKTYTCSVVATNGTGDSAASTTSSSFVAATPPSAPSVTGVIPGSNAGVVAFTANSDNGDTAFAFTGTCTSSDGGTTQTASSPSSPVTVGSLTNGKTYTCTVVATNALGNSAASAASSSFVAATVPAAPTLTGVTRGSNSAVVAFTANGNGGNAITGFTATCTSSDGGTTQSAGGPTSPLTVTSLTNAKTYTCSVVATNPTGNSAASSASTSFVAATNPSAPSITGVTLGNNAGIVAFTANSDGGDAVTAFTATCTSSNGGTTQTASGASSPVTVGSLTNGKTYTCSIVATNAMGTSAASGASSSFVAATVPVAPSAPSISSITHTAGQVVITFTPGANGGSPITGYTATCIPGDSSPTRTASGTKSPLTVTSLTVGVHYVCRVSATNAIGTSPDSNPFSFTD